MPAPEETRPLAELRVPAGWAAPPAAAHPADCRLDVRHWDAALLALREVLAACRAGRPAARAEMRPAVRHVAEAARARGLRAEEMLMRCKELWLTLPQPNGADAAQVRELRERFVTLCIAEYYGEADPH